MFLARSLVRRIAHNPEEATGYLFTKDNANAIPEFVLNGVDLPALRGRLAEAARVGMGSLVISDRGPEMPILVVREPDRAVELGNAATSAEERRLVLARSRVGRSPERQLDLVAFFFYGVGCLFMVLELTVLLIRPKTEELDWFVYVAMCSVLAALTASSVCGFTTIALQDVYWEMEHTDAEEALRECVDVEKYDMLTV